MKKIFKKLLIASVAAGTFIFNSPLADFNFVPTVYAEVKTYTGVGKCVQGDLITIEQAKNYARLRAEINAKEQAGVFLRGYSKAQNFNLTENKIEVITNSIVNIVGDVQYETETAMIGDSPVVRYVTTLNVNIDTDGINAYIQRENKNELPSTQKEIKENLDKIDNLIERYNRATTQAEKDKIRAELNQSDRNILTLQKIGEGIEQYNKGNYQETLNFCNESLKFASNDTRIYGLTYALRGLAYTELNQYDAAISDINKSIKFNPNCEGYYLLRGNVYDYLQKYEQAISDFNKAIQLNPNFFEAYYNRGNVYDVLEQYEMAILNYSKVIELNPNDENAYIRRGLAYNDLEQYDKAISDFTRAIEFNPNDERAYCGRGFAYSFSGKFQQAIRDLTNTIKLNPKFAEVYQMRGYLYQEIGEKEKAQLDFAKARELGYQK